MKRNNFSLAVALLFLLSAGIVAKGPTLRVVISGGALAHPVEIVDAVALADFNIWSGAGTSVGCPGCPAPGVMEKEAFIFMNWSAVEAPASNLPRYRVAFYADHHKDGLDYVVTYVDDTANHRGFFYLPGKGEADYALNTFSIYRGVEGRWFTARTKWVDLFTAAVRGN